MIPLVLAFAFVALTVPGAVVALRALPPIERRVLAGIKPWACDVCACFWVTAVLVGIAAAVRGPEYLLTAGPAFTVALLVLGFLERPGQYPPPPGLAEKLEGEGR